MLNTDQMKAVEKCRSDIDDAVNIAANALAWTIVSSMPKASGGSNGMPFCFPNWDFEAGYNRAIKEQTRLEKELADAKIYGESMAKQNAELMLRLSKPIERAVVAVSVSDSEEFKKALAEAKEALNRAYQSRDSVKAENKELKAKLEVAIAEKDSYKGMAENNYNDWQSLLNEKHGFGDASRKLNAEICGLREELNKAQILLAGADMDKANMQARINELNEALVIEVLENKELRMAKEALVADNDRLVNEVRNLRG